MLKKNTHSRRVAQSKCFFFFKTYPKLSGPLFGEETAISLGEQDFNTTKCYLWQNLSWCLHTQRGQGNRKDASPSSHWYSGFSP